jgi:hypothetical protein
LLPRRYRERGVAFLVHSSAAEACNVQKFLTVPRLSFPTGAILIRDLLRLVCSKGSAGQFQFLHPGSSRSCPGGDLLTMTGIGQPCDHSCTNDLHRLLPSRPLHTISGARTRAPCGGKGRQTYAVSRSMSQERRWHGTSPEWPCEIRAGQLHRNVLAQVGFSIGDGNFTSRHRPRKACHHGRKGLRGILVRCCLAGVSGLGFLGRYRDGTPGGGRYQNALFGREEARGDHTP